MRGLLEGERVLRNFSFFEKKNACFFSHDFENLATISWMVNESVGVLC